MGRKKSEFERAKEWRIRMGYSPRTLGPLIGTTFATIYSFERGKANALAKSKLAPTEEVWLRYKRSCGDLDAEMNGRKKGVAFDW